MRGLRWMTLAALTAMLTAGGCCHWWCNNCERFCPRHAHGPATFAPAATPYVPCCVPICQPVCCTPGTVSQSPPPPPLAGSSGWQPRPYTGCP